MNVSKVLIVEDDTCLREALAETVAQGGYEVLTAKSAEDALVLMRQKCPNIVISDIQMEGIDGHGLLKKCRQSFPSVPVILITAHGNITEAVNALHNGAADYIPKPFEPQILLEKISRYMMIPIDENQPIAEDEKSKKLFAMSLRVADSDATVLISGESGTGKEVLARYIHDHSPRAKHPFVAINCAAIPENMLEATLFGYEKGSFTGAYKAMPGKFEQAQGGTLLLDEISEMELNLQAKILRVLQEREVERLGGREAIALDVRVIATTNRELHEEVAAGRFREDLFYRLNVFPLHWIPLRERPNDILPMADYLLHRHHTDDKKPLPQFSIASKLVMQAYDWPGNAREMDNVIQRALILQTGGVIEPEDLHIELPERQVKSPQMQLDALSDDLLQHEFQRIIESMEKHQGNRRLVADSLGVSARTLRYKLAKMREYGIDCA